MYIYVNVSINGIYISMQSTLYYKDTFRSQPNVKFVIKKSVKMSQICRPDSPYLPPCPSIAV